MKCVPQAFDHICHLNICTGIGLLFSFKSRQVSTGWSLQVGSRCVCHMWPPTFEQRFHRRWCLFLPGGPWLFVADGGQGGRFSDHCSVSLSSRRESVLSVLALRKEREGLISQVGGVFLRDDACCSA